jgi:hypothetical protein
MQIPLTRAFAMKPTNNDVLYMQNKTEMILDKIIDSVIFAKNHQLPELVDSPCVMGVLRSGNRIMYLTESEAWSKNRTIKPKVYEMFVSLLEDYALYIYQLTYVATGKEYSFGFNDVRTFEKLCDEFKYDIAEDELREARSNETIDYETYMLKMKELQESIPPAPPMPIREAYQKELEKEGITFQRVRFVDSAEPEKGD